MERDVIDTGPAGSRTGADGQAPDGAGETPAPEISATEMPATEMSATKSSGDEAGAQEMDAEEVERLTNDIVSALKTVYDPEIPVDIFELGLIYKVEIDDDHIVTVDMTLTAPGCPVAGDMPIWVENAVASVPGVSGVKVNMVFDPPWDMDRMSDEARVALNMW